MPKFVWNQKVMEKQTKEIKYRQVNLSDLQAIKSIYRKIHDRSINGEDNLHQHTALLLADRFGLPLMLADCDKEIVGFASVVINKSAEIEINSFMKNGFEVDCIARSLQANAQKSFRATFLNNKTDNLKLKAHIDSFVEWLNSSN